MNPSAIAKSSTSLAVCRICRAEDSGTERMKMGAVFCVLLKSCIGLCGEGILARRSAYMPRTGRPRSAIKRDDLLKANAYTHEREAFDEACSKASVTPPQALRALAAAWVEYARTAKRPTLHIKITSTNGR